MSKQRSKEVKVVFSCLFLMRTFLPDDEVSRKWVGFLPEAALSDRLTIPLCDSKFLCETRCPLRLKFSTPNHREHRGTQRKTHRGRRHEPSRIGSYKRTVVCPRISRAEPCRHFRKSFRCWRRTSPR